MSLNQQQREKQLLEYIHEGGSVIFTEDPNEAQYGAVFGFKGEEPLDWRKYTPVFEDQFRSTLCTNYSYPNCLETMAKAKEWKDPDDKDINFSERWSAKTSGTTQRGNDLSSVCYAGKKIGLVLEKYAPMKRKWLLNQWAYWNKIMDMSNVPVKAKKYKGPSYSNVDGYSGVSVEAMRQALAYSPLYAGAKVGYTWEDNVVKPPSGRKAGHAFTILYIDNYIHILDSLGRPRKLLSLNYPITVAKSFRPLPEDWRIIQDKKKVQTRLIRKKGAGENRPVFAIAGGKRYWLTTWDAVSDWLPQLGYGSLDEVQQAIEELTENEINNYPYGGPNGDLSFSQLMTHFFGGPKP